MSILDEIRAEGNTPTGLPCSVEVTLNKLNEAERTELQAALDDKAIQASVIGRILRRRGNIVGDQAVRQHRRGVCRCPSPTN